MTSSPLHIDPALFDPAAIPAETRALNTDIVARLNAEPTGLSIPEIRQRRIQGLGAFPPSAKSSRAETTYDRGRRLMEPRHCGEEPARSFSHPRRRWSIGAGRTILAGEPCRRRRSCVRRGSSIGCTEHKYPAGPDDARRPHGIVHEGASFGTAVAIESGDIFRRHAATPRSATRHWRH